MRFAPSKKAAKQLSSPPPTLEKSPPRPLEKFKSDPLLQRLALIEDVVSNLQLQHDTFIPLLQIIGKVDSILELEDHAQQLVKTVSDLDNKSGKQQKLIQSLNLQSQDISIPTSLSDGGNADLKPLSEMAKGLTDIEAHSNSIAAKQKVTLKKQEVACRDEMIKTMQELEKDVTDVRSEVSQLQGDFHRAGYKEIADLEERVNNAKIRAKDDITQIESALEEHALYGGKGGDNWLLEELNHRVDESVSELSEYLEHRHRQLEVFFKQELLSLKNQHEKLSNDLSSIESYRSLADPTKQLASIIEKIKSIIQSLEKFSDNFVMMSDVTASLSQSLVDLNDKARRFIKTYKTASESKKNELFANAEVDFDSWLKGSWFEIDALRQNVENLDININSDFYKLNECFTQLETVKKTLGENGSKARIDDLRPKASSTKSKIEDKQETLHRELENLKKRLIGLWKAINKEANFNIEFISKNPTDHQMFQSLKDELISDSVNS